MKLILIAALVAIGLSACGGKSADEKIKEQVKEKTHALNPDERIRAEINAKKFFEREWATAAGARGQLNECRPSDSNFNGLVTCSGMVPQPGGGYKEVKRYCGYTPDLVGCSDEDTVK